jgi:poly(beta-D-mannuronate) lyase
MAGVALGDRDRFEWGLEALNRGVCQATPQGALPAELNRQDRALHYHVFALAPLVALAELGQRNGIASYETCNNSLQRIVSFTLSAFDDPTQINSLSGTTQLPETMDVKPSSSIAWLEIYASRYPDFIWTNRMKSMRPLVSTNLGGRLTQLYRFRPNER